MNRLIMILNGLGELKMSKRKAQMMSKSQLTKLRKEWEKKYKGPPKGKIELLPEGIELENENEQK